MSKKPQPKPIEERRLHHQTREDRQLKAYEMALERIRKGSKEVRGHNRYLFNVEAAKREAANLARKLNL